MNVQKLITFWKRPLPEWDVLTELASPAFYLSETHFGVFPRLFHFFFKYFRVFF